jgi:Transposase IS4
MPLVLIHLICCTVLYVSTLIQLLFRLYLPEYSSIFDCIATLISTPFSTTYPPYFDSLFDHIPPLFRLPFRLHTYPYFSSLFDYNMDSKATTKGRTLDDIVAEFGPINQVVFEPVQLEPSTPARALLPHQFLATSHPFNYFTLFFTPELFSTITKNTNRYAAIQRMQAIAERQREWNDLITEELYVFIGAIIYMGIHTEPDIAMYWNTDFNKGPLHPISQYITLRRFEQIKRYCHISCSESDQTAGYHLPTNKKWWYKVEPLASSLQASFQHYYSPSSEVSIDELMVRCFGR